MTKVYKTFRINRLKTSSSILQIYHLFILLPEKCIQVFRNLFVAVAAKVRNTKTLIIDPYSIAWMFERVVISQLLWVIYLSQR